MKKLIVLAFVLTACATTTAEVTPVPFFATAEAIVATRESDVAAGISTPVPTLAPGCMAEIMDGEFLGVVCEATPEPQPERTNWLLLGGDYRAHREGTGWGNKTDVIVLVSVLETDPMQVTVVQFPRNLYAPFSMGDVWLFGVWDEFGWQGLHQYFQEVFGVTLQGIHYVDMDGFVRIVDDLGALDYGGGDVLPDGESALAYLRDNENNWGMGSYDAGERVFKVLRGLWEKGIEYFLEDPVAATNIVYSRWGDVFESDLGNIEQLYWLFRLGWRVRESHIQTATVQLEEPYIIRGDTPIIQNEQPTRGMVAGRDWPIPDGPAGLSDNQILTIWMQNCVLNWVDDGGCQ